MKTRCPNCQTSFRITPEQLKARVGKVRCGQCQTVFNALDSLLDESGAKAPPETRGPALNTKAILTPSPHPVVETTQEAANEVIPAVRLPEDYAEPTLGPSVETVVDDDQALSESEAQELGKASGLIMPRETTAIPGYSKWVEGMVSTSPLSLPAEKASRWPFVLAALLLGLALAAQLVFHFRSEIAVTLPSLRPVLAALCQTIDADLPLPRRVELVSIEASDLQADPARPNLLVLNATLRNRAGYGQAFPALELSLTDTQDAAIARRVFAPKEYLPAKIAADQPFAANSEIAVRVWIEAQEISAAGYRLYVFYP